MRYPENYSYVFVVVLILAIVSLAAAANAQSAGKDIVITENVSEKDLMAGGANVQVNAQVARDAAVAGSNVIVNGPIGGYLMAAGRDVVVNSSVGNDVWAAASNVTISGAIGDNAMLAGGTVSLLPGSSIAGSARIAGGTISIQGPIKHDLMVSGGSVEIASEVGGNVEANVGRLKLLPGAVVRGDLIVSGTTPPEIAPDAQVLGQVKFTRTDTGNAWLSWLGWWLFYFLVLLATGVVLLLFSQVWMGRVARQITSKPLKTLLGGIIGLVVGPILIVILGITVIGIALALVLLAIYCVFAILAAVYVAYTVGGWLLGIASRRAEVSSWLRMIIGALVVSLLISLPWIGWLVQLVVLVFGFGAVMLERWDLRQQLTNEGRA